MKEKRKTIEKKKWKKNKSSTLHTDFDVSLFIWAGVSNCKQNIHNDSFLMLCVCVYGILYLQFRMFVSRFLHFVVVGTMFPTQTDDALMPNQTHTATKSSNINSNSSSSINKKSLNGRGQTNWTCYPHSTHQFWQPQSSESNNFSTHTHTISIMLTRNFRCYTSPFQNPNLTLNSD